MSKKLESYIIRTFRPGFKVQNLRADKKYNEICQMAEDRVLAEKYPTRSPAVSSNPYIYHIKEMTTSPEFKKAELEAADDPMGTLITDDAELASRILHELSYDKNVYLDTLLGKYFPENLKVKAPVEAAPKSKTR